MAAVPFPPEPRATPELVDAALEQLHDVTTVDWAVVAAAQVDPTVAWAGVQVTRTGHLRPWLFDVVTPADASHDRLRSDPLVLAVVQDVVRATVVNSDDTAQTFRLAVPVIEAPDTVELAAAALPPEPWVFMWESGWTDVAVGAAMQQWFDIHHGDITVPATFVEVGDKIAFGDGLFCDSGAMDGLLSYGVDIAAIVTTVFCAFVEALGGRVAT